MSKSALWYNLSKTNGQQFLPIYFHLRLDKTDGCCPFFTHFTPNVARWRVCLVVVMMMRMMIIKATLTHVSITIAITIVIKQCVLDFCLIIEYCLGYNSHMSSCVCERVCVRVCLIFMCFRSTCTKKPQVSWCIAFQ